MQFSNHSRLEYQWANFKFTKYKDSCILISQLWVHHWFLVECNDENWGTRRVYVLTLKRHLFSSQWIFPHIQETLSTHDVSCFADMLWCVYMLCIPWFSFVFCKIRGHMTCKLLCFKEHNVAALKIWFSSSQSLLLLLFVSLLTFLD